MEIQYDEVLVSGIKNDIRRFASENGIVVDWRGDDDEIVNDFGSKLENENLSAEYTDEGLLVNYNGIEHEIMLPQSLKNRYATIRGLMNILKDKYEIRVFEDSLGGDTHVFYIKPKEWWAFMDENFPQAIKDAFFKIDDELDFGGGRDAFYATGVEN